jgi:hypothetical protein
VTKTAQVFAFGDTKVGKKDRQERTFGDDEDPVATVIADKSGYTLLLSHGSQDVAHCYDTSLEGWTVLMLRRHAGMLAETTAEEASELETLVRLTSRALAEVTGWSPRTLLAQPSLGAANPAGCYDF